MSFILCIKQQI